jgi:hypothetical protein
MSRPRPKPTKFQERHVLEFGLTIQHRDVDRQVDSVRCEFCQHFGRELKPDAWKAVRKSVIFFKSPFRRGQYVIHLEGQHPVKWQEYQQLAPQQQLTFFVESAMVNHTAHATNTVTTQQQQPPEYTAEYTEIQKLVQQYKETATTANKEGKKLRSENELLEKQLRKCQKQVDLNKMFVQHDKTKIENLLKEKGQLEELNKMLQGTSNANDHNDDDNDNGDDNADDSTNNDDREMEEL